MEQRRNFGRIPFGTTTYLQLDRERHAGSLIDISLKGAQIQFETPIQMAIGQSCRLSIPLSDNVLLTFNAEVVHCQDHRTGFKFTALDADTFAHLVRLLELNTGDPEQVEQELRFLAKSP
jgi:hypothetical protein